MAEKTLPPGVAIVDTNEASGLIPNLSINVGNLDRAKRGDFVRLMLKFKTPAVPEVPAGPTPNQPFIPGTPENPKATEFITAVIASRNATSGLTRVRVYSRPRLTQYHAVTYGDDLTLSDRYILSHEPSTPELAQSLEPLFTGVIPQATPINSEDAALRTATKNLPPLAPNPQQQYWLRNGALVTVYMFHAGVWIGAGQDGTNYEWLATGAHAGGQRDLDIVKDPRASEVLR